MHIASGVAVLLTSLVFVHLIHHAFIAHRHEFHPGFLAGALLIVVPVGILSFIGAYLLLSGGRAQNSN
jgi:hypothetical protein